MTKQRARYYEISPGIFSPLNDGETGPSELATPEPAGPAPVVAAVATCSLPVSSARGISSLLRKASATYWELGMLGASQQYTEYADLLDANADAESSTERQPEENIRRSDTSGGQS